MTALALRVDPMAKKKVASVQIAEDLVKSMRVVSALVDKPMNQLIDEILRPVIERMKTEEVAKAAKADAAQKKGGKT